MSQQPFYDNFDVPGHGMAEQFFSDEQRDLGVDAYTRSPNMRVPSQPRQQVRRPQVPPVSSGGRPVRAPMQQKRAPYLSRPRNGPITSEIDDRQQVRMPRTSMQDKMRTERLFRQPRQNEFVSPPSPEMEDSRMNQQRQQQRRGVRDRGMVVDRSPPIGRTRQDANPRSYGRPKSRRGFSPPAGGSRIPKNSPPPTSRSRSKANQNVDPVMRRNDRNSRAVVNRDYGQGSGDSGSQRRRNQRNARGDTGRFNNERNRRDQAQDRDNRRVNMGRYDQTRGRGSRIRNQDAVGNTIDRGRGNRPKVDSRRFSGSRAQYQNGTRQSGSRRKNDGRSNQNRSRNQSGYRSDRSGREQTRRSPGNGRRSFDRTENRERGITQQQSRDGRSQGRVNQRQSRRRDKSGDPPTSRPRLRGRGNQQNARDNYRSKERDPYSVDEDIPRQNIQNGRNRDARGQDSRSFKGNQRLQKADKRRNRDAFARGGGVSERQNARTQRKGRQSAQQQQMPANPRSRRRPGQVGNRVQRRYRRKDEAPKQETKEQGLRGRNRNNPRNRGKQRQNWRKVDEKTRKDRAEVEAMLKKIFALHKELEEESLKKMIQENQEDLKIDNTNFNPEEIIRGMRTGFLSSNYVAESRPPYGTVWHPKKDENEKKVLVSMAKDLSLRAESPFGEDDVRKLFHDKDKDLVDLFISNLKNGRFNTHFQMEKKGDEYIFSILK